MGGAPAFLMGLEFCVVPDYRRWQLCCSELEKLARIRKRPSLTIFVTWFGACRDRNWCRTERWVL